ncbi:hypothetical protein OBBRIDRAFT_741939 [Obba rivulosa]|uniref:DUF6570 domain-containing protein n=1 Tax=Obba rivulosa TaxID=1052685 RepID=A0A8E2AGU4_9APHY|nr:hypothetical protein OBBRIDRAFT_741939 [Obba rivulosa]
MDECLAIMFIGASPPSPADFKRTPLLMRHAVVLSALRWLKLKHIEYSDVVISLNNLYEYPADVPPVYVMYQPGDGEAPAPAQSVHEEDQECGSKDGLCLFIVHGLTGADLAHMSHHAKIATALHYFENGGKVVGLDRGSDPTFIYHNPALFPRMFPWLFSYGLGGFENNKLRTGLSRTAHQKHSLLYNDRRFQMDPHFAFMIFNHEQIRASTKGGYLLTERQHFNDVVGKLLNIDTDTL